MIFIYSIVTASQAIGQTPLKANHPSKYESPMKAVETKKYNKFKDDNALNSKTLQQQPKSLKFNSGRPKARRSLHLEHGRVEGSTLGDWIVETKPRSKPKKNRKVRCAQAIDCSRTSYQHDTFCQIISRSTFIYGSRF